MAVVAAPVAAAGVGALYVAALSKTYSAAANFSAERAFGADPYRATDYRKLNEDIKHFSSNLICLGAYRFA